MGKPEDIPQDVWEAVIALQMALGCCGRHEVEGLVSSNTMIARAILAAKAEEREACAEAARRHLEVKQQVSARSNLVGYAAEFYGGAKFTVPAAIRKRGEANVSTVRKSENQEA